MAHEPRYSPQVVEGTAQRANSSVRRRYAENLHKREELGFDRATDGVSAA